MEHGRNIDRTVNGTEDGTLTECTSRNKTKGALHSIFVRSMILSIFCPCFVFVLVMFRWIRSCNVPSEFCLGFVLGSVYLGLCSVCVRSNFRLWSVHFRSIFYQCVRSIASSSVLINFCRIHDILTNERTGSNQFWLVEVGKKWPVLSGDSWHLGLWLRRLEPMPSFSWGKACLAM